MSAEHHPLYGALLDRMAELADLQSISGLLFWDRSTMMPANGGETRAHAAAALERVSHQKLTHPEIGRLLDELEPWSAELDPDSDEARTIAVVRRDFEKAARVPEDLAAELAHAESTGEEAWLKARSAGDFALFRDALATHVELRHRYVNCFEGFEHPYDVLLDDYEPDLRLSELRPLLSELQAALVPLVAGAAARADAKPANVLAGAFEADAQRAAVLAVVGPLGFDAGSWRLDPSAHPFAVAQGRADVRVTTIFDPADLGVALYSVLHEFGHGLYEAGVDPRYARTALGSVSSLGLHESQSRLWENVIGRSRPFSGWLLTILREHFPAAFASVDADLLFRSVNAVEPSLIRIFADEATYNLHIVLRTELEARLIEGDLEVDDLPDAFDAGMQRLLGLEVPDVAHGVLQDIHWGAGLFGYFPTYALGNLMSAQLFAQAEQDLPGLDGDLARGDVAAIRSWLVEHVHRHGRKFTSRELLRRVTGQELRVEPLIGYLQAKLTDTGQYASPS